MVICIIALPIFAILGLFSLKYRVLAAEAFRCLFKTIQLKPCDSGLDNRIKSKFTAKLMWWPWLARTFYNYFEVLSWIFVILALLSMLGVGYGIYNYAVYGNCNGPDSPNFCVYNIVHPNQPECSVIEASGKPTNVNISKINVGSYPIRGDEDDFVIIHEFGCYSCPYTKEAEDVVRQILNDFNYVKLVWHDVPLEIYEFSIEAAKGAICAGEQGRYWEYHDLIFEQDNLNNESFGKIAMTIGLDMGKFNRCFGANSTLARIRELQNEAREIGIYGTPTFVIGNKVLVGQQNYKTFKSVVEI
ncbi:MAG: thioredoxin domain-containing protein [Candidatus Pacearchaeota archaeon]